MAIDFSSLNDDDLLNLVEDAIVYALNRKTTREEMVTILETRIKNTKKNENTQDQDQEDLDKAKQSLKIKLSAVKAIKEWCGSDADSFQINVWRKGSDIRVYFQSADTSKYYAWNYCFYLSGNKYQPAGTLVCEGRKNFFSDKQSELKLFLQEIAKTWKENDKISSNESGEFDIEYLERYKNTFNPSKSFV